MEISEAKIEYTVAKRVKCKPIVIAPIGDIHYGATSCTMESYAEHIKYVTSVGSNVYFIGMGDMLDFMAESQRRRVLHEADLHTTTRQVLDNLTRRYVMDFCDIIKKSKGKWLGMLSGNHMYEFLDGTNSDQMMCKELDAPYLGHCAYLKLEFTRSNAIQADNTSTRGSIVLWLHHGKGTGGSTAGAVLNRLQRMAGGFDADIYIMGHLHKIAYTPIPYLRLLGMTVQNRTKHLVSIGGFLKGYEEHSRVGNVPAGSYIEKGSLLPNAIGSPLIKIWPRIHEGAFVPEIVVEGGSFSVPQL